MTDLIHSWLELEHHLLEARRPVEAAFTAVNLSHSLVPYRHAALWRPDGGVMALSGNAAIEEGSPYLLWLDSLFRRLAGSSARMLTAADIPAALAEQWADWLPEHGLLLPVDDGLLLFVREEAFSPGDVALLERLARLTGLSLRAWTPKRLRFRLPRGRKAWMIVAAMALASLFPVTGSVLAPADSVAAHPVVVRAPLDGVIETLAVQPNEPVGEGQALFALDSTTLAGRLDVSRQQQATAEAEYRQAAQAMVFDAKAKAQAAILAGKAEEKAAEVRLLESQLERISVKAPRAGIAVFDSTSDWIGRPVGVGQKVMEVADEADTEIEAWVSVADVGEVRSGGPLTLFLNIAPLSPLRAKVRTIAYEASARPDGSVAHRVRAALAEDADKPRLGLKGTARIDGDTVPLAWWLFRRPLSIARQFLGF